MTPLKVRPSCASASDKVFWSGGLGHRFRRPRRSEVAKRAPQMRQQSCRTRNLAVYVLQVGFDGNVGAECLSANFLQRRELEIRRDGEGHSRFARDFGRIKEKKLVDNSRSERCAIERGAGFEKDAEDIAAAKFG